LVIGNREAHLGDGVVVVGGGFLIGATFGILAIGFVLYRFWPTRRKV
jgi:hypothetical protein